MAGIPTSIANRGIKKSESEVSTVASKSPVEDEDEVEHGQSAVAFLESCLPPFQLPLNQNGSHQEELKELPELFDHVRQWDSAF